jgi:exodeoxyribonuclease VII small subunit
MSKNSNPLEQLTYEQAFSELADIVTRLENSQVTLEESMALFDRGQNLAKHCTLLLDTAELKVKTLTGEELLNLDSENQGV